MNKGKAAKELHIAISLQAVPISLTFQTHFEAKAYRHLSLDYLFAVVLLTSSVLGVGVQSDVSYQS